MVVIAELSPNTRCKCLHVKTQTILLIEGPDNLDRTFFIFHTWALASVTISALWKRKNIVYDRLVIKQDAMQLYGMVLG